MVLVKQKKRSNSCGKVLRSLQASHLSYHSHFKACIQPYCTVTNMHLSYALTIIMASLVTASALPAAVPADDNTELTQVIEWKDEGVD